MSKISFIYTLDSLLTFLPTTDSKARLLSAIHLDYHVFFKDVAEYLRLGCYSFSGKSGFYENQDYISLVAYDIWLAARKVIHDGMRMILISWYPLARANQLTAYEITIEILPWIK